MPELPEVETVRRILACRLTGRCVERVDVRDERLRRPVDPPRLRADLIGRRFLEFRRRAKYVLGDTDDGDTLVVHLGMSGGLRIASSTDDFAPHTHVVLTLDDDTQLRFIDPRRFGLVLTTPTSTLERHALFRDLGLEPLSASCTAVELRRLAVGRRAPIKNFVMDARRVVGVGNIYASEALHRAGIHPRRAAGRLSIASWQRLTQAIRDVLDEAIRRGGTTLNDFADTDGYAGRNAEMLGVYGREGASCLQCSDTVRRIVLGGRSTFYCARCQR